MRSLFLRGKHAYRQSQIFKVIGDTAQVTSPLLVKVILN